MSTLPAPRGHGAAWQALENALARNRLPHALLINGPPGIGKLAFARRFAARLLCGEGAPPCGECSRCRQIAAGSHPDVTLIELPAGKKEIGIDQARKLKQLIQLQANPGSRKIAVIDDADRLSIAAQNALLKTLEEPPRDALLLLVAASPGSLLATVRSRCQRLTLLPLSDEDMRAVLAEHNIDAADIEPLVERAGGSPGRALAMRDLAATGVQELQELVAALHPARYVPGVVMSRVLGKSETEMRARLESLLEWYRAESKRAALGGADASVSLAAAEIVGQALDTLRRRNPNRPLLAEALALRLARAGVGRT